MTDVFGFKRSSKSTTTVSSAKFGSGIQLPVPVRHIKLE
jgi:hypothetical protein